MATSHEIEQHQINLDKAKQLQASLDNARLHILQSREQFYSKTIEGLEDRPGSRAEGSSAGYLRHPAGISGDVAAQLSFLRKLKFQYLEQNAKDKYVKTIVNDEAPAITADDNLALRAANERKKETLKAAKLQLAEKYDDVRRLGPLVEHDYTKAKNLTSEAVSLTQSILDARLAITRLRQAHPQPRLTVRMAEEQLAAQVEAMQTLEDELQEANERVARVKESVKLGATEVERLRIERAEVERKMQLVGNEAGDGRVVGLYDWYTARLALDKALLHLHSSHSVSENELRLTYDLPVRRSPGATRRITVVLLFLPNTRQLADARIEGLDEVDMGAVIMAHAQANDVPSLISAILARARTVLQ